MDYFSELMESYDKLKKRTFKLTYISEAEEGKETQEVKAEPGGDAETALLQILGNAVEGGGQPITDPSYPGLAAFMMWRGTTGKNIGGVVVSHGRGQAYVVDAGGNFMTTPGAIKKKEEMLNAMGGGEEGNLSPGQQADRTAAEVAAEQARLEAEAKEARLTTLGSLIDEANAENPEEPRFLNPKAIKALETKNSKQLDELCAKGLLSDTVCKSDRVRSQYIGGSRGISLESKLVNGTGFVGFDENGLMVRHQVGEQEIHDAFQTNLDLLKEMGRGEPDCDYVKDRLGLVGNSRVVLFTNPGGDGDSGMVLTPNALHNSMLDRFKDCDIKEYEFKGSTNALNETKGRFNENFMGLITRVYAAVRGFSKGATDSQKKTILKPILKDFEEGLQSTLASLQEFAGETPMSHQGVDLESYPVMEEVETQLSTLTTKGETKRLVEQMMVQMGGLLKRLSADDIIAGGTAQRLGGKVDNFFLYKGEEGLAMAQARSRHLGLKPEDVVTETPAGLYDNATEALKPQIEKTLSRQGLSVSDTTTPLHLLSAGNKLSVGDSIKFGDLSLGRGMDIVMGAPITGSSPPADEAAWYAKLDSSLQFEPTDLGEQGSVATYAGSVQTRFNNCSKLSKEVSYSDENGEIALSNPKQISKVLQKTVQDKFVYGQKDSNFYNACTQVVDNPHGSDPKTVRELRDLSTPENQKRASEALQRDYLSHQFKKDYESDDPIERAGATNALCRMAGATIMEQTEMGQIITQEGVGMQPILVNQNDILRGIGEARKNGSLKIEFGGSTFKFKFKVNGQDISYNTNLERQKGRPAMSGHISKEDASKVGGTVKPLSPRQIQADTMYQYMVGQMRLLETLINQAKGSHPH